MNSPSRFLIAVGTLILASVSGAAQQAPGSLADAHNPSGPPGPMESPQIWKVNPLTGALTLQVPLNAPLPGGRGPHYGQSLLYNSASTVTLQFQQINTISNYAMYTWTGANQSLNQNPPNGPWIWSGPIIRNNSGQSVADQPIVEMVNGNPTTVGGFQGCNITGPVLYEDADGGSHDLNVAYVALNTGGNYSQGTWNVNPACQYTNTSTGSTIDGSALATSLNYNTPSAIGPDGMAISQNGTLEDSNGNVNNGQDSEGRAQLIPSANCATSGSLSSSPSTCTYTTYDSNDAPINYSVSSETVTIGSFTMPHPLITEMTNPYMAGGMNTSGIQVNENPQGTAITGVSSIGYPDGTSYGFSYKPTSVTQCPNNPVYGTITQITFPTGGYVNFCWGIRNIGESTQTVSAQSTLVVTDVYLSSGSGTPSHWNYVYQNLVQGESPTSTETAPDGTVTVYTAGVGPVYSTIFNRGAVGTLQETQRDITSGSGAHLRTVNTVYGGGFPTQVTTTYWDVSPSLQQTVHYNYDVWNNVIEKDESDFYTGTPSSPPWLRKTFTTYTYNQPYCPQAGTCPSGTAAALATAHIVNKPSSVTVTDGNGNPYSIAEYGYDESPLSTNVGSGILHHDDLNYPQTKQTGRGNLTTEAKCAAISAGSCASWLITTHVYDLTGQLYSTTDPNGNATYYSFADSYSKGTPSAQTNSYLTKVIQPNPSLVDHYTYNYYTARETAHTDWNSQTTTYSYVDPFSGTADPFHRLRQIILPTTTDGTTQTPGKGTTTYTYTDAANSFAIEEQQLITSGTQTQTTTYFDGLARAVTKITLVPECSTGIQVQTTYDVMSRAASVTNPYCSTSDPTYGVTQYTYDALGRKMQTTLPDGSGSSMSYAGNVTTFTDENLNQWARTTDGLGRLTVVKEPNGSAQAPSMETDYAYDPLSNLLSVKQWGGANGSPAPNGPVGRTFAYDGASRLIASNNPESASAKNPSSLTCSGAASGTAWTTCYSYDGDGNLVSKTDNRYITTAFTYDTMNHLLSKTFSSDGNWTPFSCYQYGTATGFTGRLINAWTQPASSGACSTAPPATGYLTMRSILSYDAVGRVLSEHQYTPASQATGTVYAPAYTYDLAGNLIGSTSGVGPTSTAIGLTNQYDEAMRLQKVNSNVATYWANGASYPTALFFAQSATGSPLCGSAYTPPYSAFGSLENATFGNGLTLNRAYDKRSRITCEKDQGSNGSTVTGASAAILITGAEQTK